eukprot:TRINITY_DN289_c0_g1_i4.p4 TRINITY_DN289_c0_g1~~TRINITY_DN289_c0_g1_i4.p4  ORF type:complete len:103 (+),score=2.99 TRINITY_DN289_c0_g1_i4:1693-2001(+)
MLATVAGQRHAAYCVAQTTTPPLNDTTVRLQTRFCFIFFACNRVFIFFADCSTRSTASKATFRESLFRSCGFSVLKQFSNVAFVDLFDAAFGAVCCRALNVG